LTISSSWLPVWATRAPSSTTIRSVHPNGAEAVRHEDRDPAVSPTVTRTRDGPARRRGIALEQRVLGLDIGRRRGLVEQEQQRLVAHEAPM